jgi:uracil-DNA glycosylase
VDANAEKIEEITEFEVDYPALAELNGEIESCHVCAERGFVAITRPIERGNARQRIWLVGQAPGWTEGTRKVAFGGPAGRKLMSWFAQVGLSEEQVRDYFYLSAITKCYPGRAPGGGGDRNPSPIERALCRRFLLRELYLLQPLVVILVGSTAIKEVYGDKVKLDAIIGTHREMSLAELQERLSVRSFKAGMPIPPPPSNFRPDAHTEIYHLPHPSGASTWLNLPENQALLQQSLASLQARLAKIAVMHKEEQQEPDIF